MAYTTAAKIRSLTDLTEQEISDDDLTEHIIPSADAIVDHETGRSWSPSDEDYEIVSLAATWLSAWLVYKKLLGTKKAEKYRQAALKELAKLTGPGGPLTYNEQ